MARQSPDIVNYDTITNLITEYGATKFAEGCAISESTATVRAEQAATILTDITIKLHRLYVSLGEDV